jgi:Tfp pilus assembly protein PilF
VDALLGWGARRPEPPSRRSPADALVRRAWVAQRNGRPAEALALLEEAIPLDPSFEEAWLLKAECFETPGERLTCLWEALAANPDSAELRAASDQAARLVQMAQEAPSNGAASVMRPVFEHGAR